MKKLDIAKRLLKIQMDIDTYHNNLFECGCELNLPIDLTDLALDVLGVPEDNTVKVGCYSNDTFCRDWFYDAFYDSKNLSEAIKKIMIGVKELEQ